MTKWGKVDYKQFEQFKKKLEKLQRAELQKFCEAAAKELAARLLRRVIELTPVGTKPKITGKKTVKVKGASGKTRSFLTAEAARHQQYWSGYTGGTLRRGWTGGINQNAAMYAKSLPVRQAGNVYIIDIINPVEYAPYVEFGHRQQPGRYVPALGKKLKADWVPGRLMLTKSEIELEGKLQGILEKKLLKYLGDYLNGN